MGNLILLRHGESVWNAERRFTGWAEVELSPKGEAAARLAAEALRGLRIDVVFTSMQKRAQRTVEIIMECNGWSIPVRFDAALNERNYGELQGMNKDEAAAKFGLERVETWRRSYDVRPPGGESLKDTAARVVPFMEEKIIPETKGDRAALTVAHGNSLRAAMMHLERISAADVVDMESPPGVPILYRIDGTGAIREKRFLL